eukprot:Tbor_TRINITY_DN5079_c0_g2::TRINITY_DN5079_c0_g2_i1::g.14301::m.14301
MTDVSKSQKVRYEGRSKPEWTTIPGGPKEPIWSEFLSRLHTLNNEKSELFTSLKAINEKMGNKGEKSPIDEERAQLRSQMNALRAKQADQRSDINEKRADMKKIREDKYAAEAQLRQLTDELGAFSSVDEIDKAIDHILYKMETGGSGSLAEEKKTAQRLSKLESAKALLLNLQPMQDAIEEADAKEREIQQEIREIHLRSQQLSKEFNQAYEEKKSFDCASSTSFEEKKKYIEERSRISKRITEIQLKSKQIRDEYDDQRKAWDLWKVEAMAIHKKKVEEQRAENERKWKERQDAKRLERKKEKIAKRRNPFEAHISTSALLIRYLKDKQIMVKRGVEERERRAREANFNPEAGAPTGFVLLKPKLEDPVVPKKKSAKKKEKEKEKSKANSAEKDKKTSTEVVTHSVEKERQFALVSVEPPTALEHFEPTIAELQRKVKEYESHITTVDDVSSSDDEDNKIKTVNQQEETIPVVTSTEAATVVVEDK